VKLKDDELTEDELNPGRFKTTLQFFLPKGSYATVLVREYLKPPLLQVGRDFLSELR
jgi:tRNA pseudouridine13 synthase